MQNYRLTQKNQWGETLYIGKYRKGYYQNWEDFPENLSKEAIEEIMEKLYSFEESFEDLIEKVNSIGNINVAPINELRKAVEKCRKPI